MRWDSFWIGSTVTANSLRRWPLHALFAMTSDCWLWTKNRDKDGYGRVKIEGKSYRAHRVAFALFKDFANPRMMVCHKCDNPPCFNPDHLFAGYGSDNVRDAYRKGRHSQKGERANGKKLSAAQVEEIKKLRATGRYSQKELGRMFGVRQTSISNILRGKTWTY